MLYPFIISLVMKHVKFGIFYHFKHMQIRLKINVNRNV